MVGRGSVAPYKARLPFFISGSRCPSPRNSCPKDERRQEVRRRPAADGNSIPRVVFGGHRRLPSRRRLHRPQHLQAWHGSSVYRSHTRHAPYLLDRIPTRDPAQPQPIFIFGSCRPFHQWRAPAEAAARITELDMVGIRSQAYETVFVSHPEVASKNNSLCIKKMLLTLVNTFFPCLFATERCDCETL